MAIRLYEFGAAASLASRAALIALLLVGLAVASPAGAATGPVLDEERGVMTLAPVLEDAAPAVVNISVRARVPAQGNPMLQDPFFRRFFNLPEEPPEREVMSAGSGVIVDAHEGLVLTNHHVVRNAEEIRVILKDRRQLDAELIGSDPETDIALLKVPADGLSALPLGDSDDLRVGDIVVAIGNPFGLGQTVTLGIVSALGRHNIGMKGYEDFIQTDASINPGNSGGALINSKGELVGINTAIIAPGGGNVGVGFAVPINMARVVMEQLVAHGEVRRGRLGIVIQDVTPDLAEALRLDGAEGAIIAQVEDGSAADEAGLEAGDVITALDGVAVRDATDLRNRVGLTPVGETVTLSVVRDGRERTVDVVVRRVKTPRQQAGASAFERLEGASFRNLEPGMPQYGKVDGVLVSNVEQGSRAWMYGLRAGDVILGVNRQRVASVSDLREILQERDGALALHVGRDGRRIFIAVR